MLKNIQSPSAVVIAAGAIVGSPLVWNILARSQYRSKWMEKLCGGKQAGANAMAAWIFFTSLYRDWLFLRAVQTNPASLLCDDKCSKATKTLAIAGNTIVAAGSVLVLASYYRLGITGTYLGDYFGIYMTERVTKFPFNVIDDPMYTGSTLCFLGQAVAANSAIGTALSAWVWGVYKVASKFFEDPFTTMIYEKKAEEEEAAAQKKSE